MSTGAVSFSLMQLCKAASRYRTESYRSRFCNEPFFRHVACVPSLLTNCTSALLFEILLPDKTIHEPTRNESVFVVFRVISWIALLSWPRRRSTNPHEPEKTISPPAPLAGETVRPLVAFHAFSVISLQSLASLNAGRTQNRFAKRSDRNLRRPND